MPIGMVFSIEFHSNKDLPCKTSLGYNGCYLTNIQIAFYVFGRMLSSSMKILNLVV